MSENVEHARAESSGLTVELLPHVAVFGHDEPEITAWLGNHGGHALRLVMPGDGSIEGWRTPLIDWRFTPDTSGIGEALKTRGCGNLNAIRRNEVFTLAPGERRNLGDWIVPSLLPSAAEFSASLTYSNDPTLPLRGVLSGPHDEGALSLVRGSDRCCVRSNEIRIRFERDSADALRPWCPEVVAMVRDRWSDGMNCDELIGLRDDVQRTLGAIRAGRGIQAGPRWIQSERHAGIRIRQWCGAPRVSVRALILALGRFHIANAHVVSDLEQRWRLFRREHGLDVEGARTPIRPPTR